MCLLSGRREIPHGTRRRQLARYNQASNFDFTFQQSDNCLFSHSGKQLPRREAPVSSIAITFHVSTVRQLPVLPLR